MKTIDNIVKNEIVIDRSRFICHLKRVTSMEEASEFINSIKKEHWNANHNCSAVVLHNNARSSDDGEPSGTAGVPMLNVLKQNGLDEVVAVVTRYFGGIKLGAGGLIRAYSSAVSEALLQARIVEIVEMQVITVTTDYANANTISSKVSLPIQNTDYMSNVTLTFFVDFESVELFISEITNLTSANFTYDLPKTILYKKD